MHAHYLITLCCFALEVEMKVNPELSLYTQCTITFKFMCVQIQSLYIHSLTKLHRRIVFERETDTIKVRLLYDTGNGKLDKRRFSSSWFNYTYKFELT